MLAWKDMHLQCSFDCAACKSKINMMGRSGLWRHSRHYVAGFPQKFTAVRSISLPCRNSD